MVRKATLKNKSGSMVGAKDERSLPTSGTRVRFPFSPFHVG